MACSSHSVAECVQPANYRVQSSLSPLIISINDGHGRDQA